MLLKRRCLTSGHSKEASQAFKDRAQEMTGKLSHSLNSGWHASVKKTVKVSRKTATKTGESWHSLMTTVSDVYKTSVPSHRSGRQQHLVSHISEPLVHGQFHRVD